MKTESLEKFCNKLFRGLLEEFIFFIPNTVLFSEQLETQNLSEFKKYFQKVIYMDHMQGPLIYSSKRKGPDMLIKAKLLNKNILSLIEKSEDLSKANFNYVNKKYVDQVRGLALVSNWMNDQDRLKGVEGIDTKTKTSFRLQSELFEKHLNEMATAFETEESETKKDIDILNDLELQVPRLIEQIKQVGDTQSNQIEIITQLVQSSQRDVISETKEAIPLKKQKRILISEDEAEEFLFKTLFGLRLN